MSFSYKFNNFDKINIELDKIPQNLALVLDRSARQMAQLWLDLIKNRAPFDEGKYANSWNIDSINIQGNGAQIILGTPEGLLYVLLEFTGRKSGRINAKEGGVLRWEDETGVHFAKYVTHPGFQPSPHVRPALAELLRVAPFILLKNIGEVSPIFRKYATTQIPRVTQGTIMRGGKKLKLTVVHRA